MDKKLNYEINHPCFWADLVGEARYIVNSTAPGEYCYMSESSVDLFRKLTVLTAEQMFQLAKAMYEMESNEAKEAQARI
jgi:hypothetical protein